MENLFEFSSIEKILLYALGLLWLIQIIYYLCLYRRIYARNQAVKRGKVQFSQELPPISIVIVARDDAEGLRRNLTTVLAQDYPEFEVIVINDGDTGGSDEYLTQLEEQYPNLYHSYVPESSRYISHRKLAITLGIKASKYDWLVMTNADCRPQSDQWLRMMARNFTPATEVVLGYSGYKPGKGWLHRKVTYDNLFTSMRYLGLALNSLPYMGIGRNLAYRKELFYKEKGFSSHLHLLRGDDDLFINQVATGKNTRVETDPLATVRTQPIHRAKSWREEKIGYASTARLYRGGKHWLLGGETLSKVLLFGICIAALALSILHRHWLVAGIVLLTLLIRFSVQASVINLTAKSLDEKRRYYLSLPLLDLLQPLQSLYWKLTCMFRKKSEFLRK